MTHYSKEELLAAWQLIKKSQTITLLTHYKPDGDGISACAALSHILENQNKTIESIYPSDPDFIYKRHPKNIKINTHTQIPDLIIVCDTSNSERCYLPDEFKNIPLINIDHHISNNINGTYNFVDPIATSTCDFLYELLKVWDPSTIDKTVAECLLVGILYDSQVFNTSSTTSKSLRIAADLMDYGVNLFALRDELIANKNPTIIALWGKILSNITISPSGQSAWARVTQDDLKEFNLTLNGLTGFNNFVAGIAGIDVSAFFYETEDGKTKVSLRSRKTDVNKLANQFGGGGHIRASGIMMDKPLDQCIPKITPLFP